MPGQRETLHMLVTFVEPGKLLRLTGASQLGALGAYLRWGAEPD